MGCSVTVKWCASLEMLIALPRSIWRTASEKTRGRKVEVAVAEEEAEEVSTGDIYFYLALDNYNG